MALQDNIYMAGTHVSLLEEEYVLDALRNGWYQDKYYYCERLQEEFSDYQKICSHDTQLHLSHSFNSHGTWYRPRR